MSAIIVYGTSGNFVERTLGQFIENLGYKVFGIYTAGKREGDYADFANHAILGIKRNSGDVPIEQALDGICKEGKRLWSNEETKDSGNIQIFNLTNPDIRGRFSDLEAAEKIFPNTVIELAAESAKKRVEDLGYKLKSLGQGLSHL